MAEFTTINAGQTLHYQGYLDFAKFWRLVRELLEKRGYQYLEQEHNEIVKKTGKNIFIHIDADKPVSDYAKLRVVLKLTVKELTEATIELEGEQRTTDEADVTLQAESYLITDYEGRYEEKGWLFFLRTITEKLFFKRELKKFQHLGDRDMKDVLREAKKYLNVFTA